MTTITSTYHRHIWKDLSAQDVAARTPFERLANQKTLGAAFYRFDTRAISGDYTLIEVALPLASEEAARNAFYHYINQTRE